MPTLIEAPTLNGLLTPDNPVAPPPTTSLGGPAFSRLRATAAVARYAGRFLPAILRRHSFVIPAELPVLHGTASLPARRIGEWKSFFEWRDDTIPPLTYFTAENSRLLFRLLGEFGPNFRHLLLVQHELVAGEGVRGLVPDAEYHLEVTIDELRVWPRQRVTFKCRCVARRAGDPKPVFETSDMFLVKNVPERDCEALAQRGYAGGRAEVETRATRLDSNSSAVRRHRLRVSMDAGIGFGVLSGDLNLVHAHCGLARFFGHRRPFAQGLYLSNRVMASLAQTAVLLPTRLAIRFCRPLYLGQDVTLLHTEEAFEVLDATCHLVAAGTCGR